MQKHLLTALATTLDAPPRISPSCCAPWLNQFSAPIQVKIFGAGAENHVEWGSGHLRKARH